MATLTNEQINLTYPGLIKTVDNLTIDATPRSLTDGIGLALPIEVSTSQINFTAGVDFSGATVTGLVAGGLVAGTDVNSMQSASFLTTSPANASGVSSIAIGNGALTTNIGSDQGVAIGNNARSTNELGIAIGTNSVGHYQGVAIGWGATNNTKGGAISIGKNAKINGNDAIAIGSSTYVSANDGIAIGNSAGYLTGAQNAAVCIGHDNGFGNGVNSVGVGFNSTAKALSSIVIGNDARVDDSAHAGAISIGNLSRSSAEGTVSLGRNVIAVNWIDSTTVNQLAINNYVALNYADDAAAATGGVPLGGIYHNAGALKIRIV